MRIASGKVAFIHYTVTEDGSGQLLETTGEGDPLGYLHGRGQILPALEAALEGKSTGDSFVIIVPPEFAYGAHDGAKVFVVERSQISALADVRPGVQLQAEARNGLQTATVVKVEGDQVTMDTNHPLAGKSLRFEGVVHGVRDATPEEIQHGHAHGPAGEHY